MPAHLLTRQKQRVDEPEVADEGSSFKASSWVSEDKDS